MNLTRERPAHSDRRSQAIDLSGHAGKLAVPGVKFDKKWVQEKVAVRDKLRTIAAFIVKKILARAVAEGLDGGALLVACEIEVEDLKFGVPVAEERHYQLWEEISDRLGDTAPGFALRYAETMKVDDYGALGLAWKTSPTFRIGLDRAVRYQSVMTNTSIFELETTSLGTRLNFTRSGARRPGMQRANEAALAEVFGVARRLMGPELSCVQVTFRHPAPLGQQLYDANFGVSVHWEAQSDSIEFPQATLDLAPPFADAALSEFILQHLEQAREGSEQPTEAIETKARRCIVRALPDGVPRMEDVAKQMGMSPRTLHRRLEEAGNNFKTIVESARRELAEQLLRAPARPLGEVAFLTGFSEPSSFHRAFKRWTGRTPADYRAQVLQN
jgi:AraC-like DNA-binding protein